MTNKFIFLMKVVLLFMLIFVSMGCESLGNNTVEPAVNESINGETEETIKDRDLEISIAAGNPVEIYFPLAAGIAYVLERRIEDITVVAETTGASVENCRLVAGGESEMGMAMADVAWDAYIGEEAFEEDGELPIRTLFSMYPAQQHLLTIEGSDIESVADLAGKTVSVDVPGSSVEETSYIILEAAGIIDEVDTVNYSQTEAREALVGDMVDAVFYNFPSPDAVVEEIMAARDVKFVPMSNELMDTIIEDYPYFSPGFIPEGHYGLKEDVPVLTVGNLMLVHEDMDEQLAYDLVSAIFHEDSLNELVGIHPIAKNFKVTMVAEAPVPFHPGAERFFEEQQ